MRKANSSGTVLRKTRYWWRALLGMALAVAMLAAMALPLHTAYAVDKDAANCSTTTLPIKTNGDPVTWTEVRQYIDDNFTGSKVFADAVYNAICTSGQDFNVSYEGNKLKDAADVIANFGRSDPTHTTIDVPQKLEPNAVLTGITLLRYPDSVRLDDVGDINSFSFIEDAYKTSSPEYPDYDAPMGPRIVIPGSMALTVFAKEPFRFNLTRTNNGDHELLARNAFYHNLPVSILRESNDAGYTQITVDTTLTGRDASVDLSSSNSSGQITFIHPTRTKQTFQPIGSSSSQSTNRITASGNKITFSIPNNGADGQYIELAAFDWMYNYVANESLQAISPNYYYRTNVSYLNTLKIRNYSTVLSDFVAKKIDADSKQPLQGARFKLYDSEEAAKAEDERGLVPQAQIDADGKVITNQDGSIQWKATVEASSDKDGLIYFRYIKPGTYWLKETQAAHGYQKIADPVQVHVGISDGDFIAPSVDNGEGNAVQVFGQENKAVVGNAKNTANWDHAATMKVSSGTYEAKLADGVYIKNNGKDVTVSDGNLLNGSLISRNPTYQVTFGEIAKSYTSAKDVQQAINDLINNRGLNASNAVITVDTGNRVYYKPVAAEKAVTVPNKKNAQPVNVSLEAQKHFKDETGNDQAIANGRFAFALTPGNANAKLLASNALNASVGTDGKATWNLPSITADVFSKATKNDKGVASFNFTASEIAGPDTDVKYDTTEIPVRLDVSETKNGADEGLKVEVFVKNKSVGSATSGKDTATLKVPVKDSGIAFTNTVVPQPVKSLFSFVKRDGDSGTVLSGAKFRLFQCTAGADKCGTDLINPDNPGSEWKKVGDDTTSGENGMVSFDVEKPGEYRLVEIQAPAGYQKPTGQWRVTYGKDDTKPTIKAIGEVPAFCDPSSDQCPGGKSSSSVSTASVMPAAAQTPLVLPNNKVIDVPSTGGRGLMLFSLAGFGLLLAGVTVLSIEARRRG
ncbi:SpaA isopeptide-forming pilin-related protein [Bifidobacterium felsineum]|uniref:SpaA isopeptide-forming pilin-related protein n=1 Tax=Bifidobacterium felsineum TaxID=2045440 RepID=UPI001BDDA518|nr:SpaA isopeptide-forming pilin-related protein [Bifidobacterium felsineum]MBT1164721.1 hypothetical protein [Bifidobacterium felsineum]